MRASSLLMDITLARTAHRRSIRATLCAHLKNAGSTMRPVAFSRFLLVAMIALVVQAGYAQWTFRPILVTHDTLPRTLKPSTPSGMQEQIVVDDQIYFKDDHGIFLAKGDSIIPIVTEVDTIPGTNELFDSFDNYGGLPGPGMFSWSLALGYVGRSSGGFDVLSPRKVGFTYAINGKLTFFVAGPGNIRCLGSLPDKVVFNDQEFETGEADGIATWLMEESSSGVMLYVLWNKYSRGFIKDNFYSAFFSFDGKTVTKLLAGGDQLGGGDSLKILSVAARRFRGPLIARDRYRDRWMMKASYDLKNQKTGEWRAGSGILMLDRSRVTSVVQEGDSIENLRGARLPKAGDIWALWQPHFTLPAVIIMSNYEENDWRGSGFFVAQGGSVRRVATWKNGDELPGTAGGRIEGFAIERLRGSDIETFAQYAVELDTSLVTSISGVGGSHADIDEGIFRWEGGTIRKIAAQGDSILRGQARVVSTVGEFQYFGSLDEMVIKATVDKRIQNQALLHWSGGKLHEITSTIGGGAIDKRRPGKGRVIMFQSIGRFEVVPGRRVVFFAGNPAVSGWFVAEPPK